MSCILHSDLWSFLAGSCGGKRNSAVLVTAETETPRSHSREQWTGFMLVTSSSPRYCHPAVTVMRQVDLPLGEAVITEALFSTPPAPNSLSLYLILSLLLFQEAFSFSLSQTVSLYFSISLAHSPPLYSPSFSLCLFLSLPLLDPADRSSFHSMHSHIIKL